MLASKAIVKQFINSITDMKCDGYYRRYWADKNKRDKTLRNCAFRFWNGNTAADVAEDLRVLLFASGYTNNVKLTFSGDRRGEHSIFDRRADSYYVRVIATAN